MFPDLNLYHTAPMMRSRLPLLKSSLVKGKVAPFMSYHLLFPRTSSDRSIRTLDLKKIRRVFYHFAIAEGQTFLTLIK